MCISVVTHLQFPVSSIFWQVQNPVKIPTSSLITKLRYQNILHQLPLTIQIFSREFPANLTYFFSIMFSYHWHNANLKKKKKVSKDLGTNRNAWKSFIQKLSSPRKHGSKRKMQAVYLS